MADADLVAAGYDAVYAAFPNSPTLQRIWREGLEASAQSDYLDQLSFVTPAELRQLADGLALAAGETLLDLGCGTGGPGLWVAARAEARLIGVDVSPIAVAQAAERAQALGFGSSAAFRVASLEHTGLDDGETDAALSIDVMQYVADKLEALREAARLLRPSGRIALTVFELDPKRASSLPIYGSDPAPDLRPLLEQAGFKVETYVETSGWRDRVTRIFEAVREARDRLARELGAAATSALLSEAELALEARPYRRRVLATGRRE